MEPDLRGASAGAASSGANTRKDLKPAEGQSCLLEVPRGPQVPSRGLRCVLEWPPICVPELTHTFELAEDIVLLVVVARGQRVERRDK